MKTNFDQFENDRMIADPTNYKWGIFYFNPRDRRTIVPRRSRMLGWTFNFVNPYTYLIILGIFFFSLVVGWLNK